ncbi:UNVERIFIED_CONTAM: protein NUCLEAR FUSION defective [Sesamum angustifolium]|uniref:Protein NUCLEAR FUSION defective n=1 Tax=Sesamum angustifolium TaxID=2727405 RepID=A0AAW2QSZ1_9LAMI
MALQWLSLVATMCLQSINGTNSNFPAYSSELKRILSISQLQLNNLASASDAGKLLGWISGLLQPISHSGWSCSLAPSSETAFAGLTRSVTLSPYVTSPWIARLLLHRGGPVSKECRWGEIKETDKRVLYHVLDQLSSGLFAVITSLGSVVSRFMPKYVVLVGMIVFLFLPLVVPLVERIREKIQHKCLIVVHDEGLASIENGEKPSDTHQRTTLEIGVVEEIGAKLMDKLLNHEAVLRTSFTRLVVFFFSFFGRLLPSLLDYFFPKSKREAKSWSMGAVMAPMLWQFFLLLNLHDVSLYASTAIIGICTGAITSISVSTTTQLFGAKNFGVNHNILVSNIPIGSFLFGDFAALLYNRGKNASGEGDCIGPECYQTTFIIWGSLCVVGTVLAFVLHARTKKLMQSHNRV